MSFSNFGNTLGRNEMSKIMAGSGSCYNYCSCTRGCSYASFGGTGNTICTDHDENPATGCKVCSYSGSTCTG